jgi:hypothetical protein
MAIKYAMEWAGTPESCLYLGILNQAPMVVISTAQLLAEAAVVFMDV